MNVQGEVKVRGVPHHQGHGAVGHVSAGYKGPVAPLAGQSSYPPGVVTDVVEEIYAAVISILGDPRRRVPHEEGGRVSLLDGCVDLLRYSGRSLHGVLVHRVNPIRVQHGLVAAGKRVCL